MLAQVVAMITPDNHDRVLRLPRRLERVENPSDLRIYEGDTGVVGLSGLEEQRFCQAVVGDRTVVGKGGDGNIVTVSRR